jgi:hypothetical protein
MVKDPAPAHDLPPMWIWAIGLILSIVGMCVVMGVQFQMPVGMTLLAVFLAFFFSFLAIQCSGVTGTLRCAAVSNSILMRHIRYNPAYGSFEGISNYSWRSNKIRGMGVRQSPASQSNWRCFGECWSQPICRFSMRFPCWLLAPYTCQAAMDSTRNWDDRCSIRSSCTVLGIHDCVRFFTSKVQKMILTVC